jgi:tripartite-type tricarboxylate transporter receptor subunit TctC
VIVAVTGLCAAVGCADVETRPPLKIVVPFAPGGGSDKNARIIKRGIELNELTERPIVIINRGGAGATIGSRYVKNAPPDGNTVLFLHEAILTAKYSGNVNYGPEAFEPIAATGRVGMVLAVASESPHETLSDLLAAAREDPDSLTFAANMGALTHFVGRQLEKAADVTFRFTQTGGGAARFTSLKGGHVDVSAFSVEEFTRYRSDGLRALALFSRERDPALPDVPTAAEQGFEIFSDNLFCWWAPKGTPPEKIEKIADLLERAMQTDFVKRRMKESHCEVLFLEGTEFRKELADIEDRIAAVASREAVDVPNFPGYVGGTVGLLLLIAVARPLVRGKTSRPGTEPREPATTTRQRWDVAGLCLALTVLYVASMSLAWCGFRTATVLFVAGTGAVLGRGRPRAVLFSLGLALTLGFGLQWLFTRVFVVDLP